VKLELAHAGHPQLDAAIRAPATALPCPQQTLPGHSVRASKPKTKMNTSNIPSRLPQAFSLINPTFASKADYLDFVQEWKAVYRYLSASIRTARLRSRLQPNNRPAKRAALEKELCLLHVRLAAYGPCPYVDHGVAYGSQRIALGATAATWLLELRTAAKIDAGRRRAATLVAREEPRPDAAP
jgi:hypothetical protein